MSEITFQILKLVVSICTILITIYIVPYIYTLKEDKRYASLISMVEVAVRAAEQTIGAGQGEAKKQEVVEFVSKWMSDNGIEISQEQLSQLIECAVYGLKK